MLVGRYGRAPDVLLDRMYVLPEKAVVGRPIGRHGKVAVRRYVAYERYLVVVLTVDRHVGVEPFQHLAAQRSVLVALARVYARPAIGYRKIAQHQMEVAFRNDLMHQSRLGKTVLVFTEQT